MIAGITGTLKDIDATRILIEQGGGLTYELLIPGYTLGRLGDQIGQAITLSTILFLESQNQGASFIPRLAGFLTESDKAFYELLVTVKGIGHRKALRVMAMPAAQIAAAIADRDVATLQTLPEIGKRTAETIIVTLKDKVESFASTPTSGQSSASDAAVVAAGGGLLKEAREVLTQLGEVRSDAITLIEQVMAQDNAPDSVEGIVAMVYQMKR